MGLRDIWIKIKGRDESKGAINSATSGVGRLGRSSVSMGKLFSKSFQLARKSVLLLTGAITSLVISGAGMIKVGYNFRKAMALVNTMLPDGSDNVKKFRKEIINLSMDLGIARDQLATGLYQTLSAGVPENNAISFLATASKAAVAGATDVATAVDALTTVVNSYAAQGVTAQQASDVLFATVKQGKTTFEELATQIGQVAGIAANSNISIESLAASIATVTKSGIDTRRAITGIRAGILATVAPSDDLAKKLKKLGTTGEELIKTRGVQGAFAEIAKMANGSQDALKKLIPQVEALPAFLALAGDNAKTAASDLKKVGDSLGEAASAYDKMEGIRGWPRLFQTISAQVTKIGMTMDEKLNPLAANIGRIIRTWGESDQFKGILTTMDNALDKAIKVGEALGAGGESRAAAKDYIQSLADTAVSRMISGGERIGEAIALGMIKSMLSRNRNGPTIMQQAVEERTGSKTMGRLQRYGSEGVGDIAKTWMTMGLYPLVKNLRHGRETLSGDTGRTNGELFSKMLDAMKKTADATGGIRADLNK